MAMVAQDPRPLGAFVPVHPVRIALTPRVDGRMEQGEWDLLYDNGSAQTYMQWEPNKLFFGLCAPDGSDLVVSLDVQGDGWLVGDDNLEIRLRKGRSGPDVSFRRLDATDPAGPVWLPADVPAESVQAAVGTEGATVCLELAFTPRRDLAPRAGDRIGVRMDAVPTGSDMGAAYLPRPVAFVRLATETGSNLPPGFSWRPSIPNRTIAREDEFKARFVMSRETEDVVFGQVAASLEGEKPDTMSRLEGPFPGWGRNNGAVYDYSSPVRNDAEPGYRVLRVELQRPGGEVAVLRTSVRVAPLVDLEPEIPSALPFKEDAQVVRGKIVVRSNGKNRVDGTLKIECPADWSVTKGKESKYTIYHSRGVAKVPFEIVVPRGELGTGRIVLTTQIGDRTIQQEVFLPVGV